jgi:positive regulator of sigma E activity
MLLIFLTFIQISLQALDCLTTYKALKLGMREGNPLMRALGKYMFPVKIVVASALIGYFFWIEAITGFIILNVMMLCLVTWNVYKLNKRLKQ